MFANTIPGTVSGRLLALFVRRLQNHFGTKVSANQELQRGMKHQLQLVVNNVKLLTIVIALKGDVVGVEVYQVRMGPDGPGVPQKTLNFSLQEEQKIGETIAKVEKLMKIIG